MALRCIFYGYKRLYYIHLVQLTAFVAYDEAQKRSFMGRALLLISPCTSDASPCVFRRSRKTPYTDIHARGSDWKLNRMSWKENIKSDNTQSKLLSELETTSNNIR
jgi:hypothetical protein